MLIPRILPLPRRLRPAAWTACVSLLSLPAASLAGAEGQPPAVSADAGTLAIEHQPPGCIQAGKPARLGACFRPQGALARARVYFRAGGTRDWFYVEMSGAPPCLEGGLPPPKKTVKRVEYYVAATDRSFAESRTSERAVTVTRDGQCSAGPVAPVASSAGSVIGSATGTVPAGFVTGGGLSPLLIAGGVAVVAGGAVAVVAAGGGGEESPTTTTLPPTSSTTTTTLSPPPPTTTTTTTLSPPPTTTTTLRPSPTTTTTTTTSTTTTSTTTTTTTLTPCETQAPTVNITAPGDAVSEPTQVTITADASDPAPGSGVKEVRFSWQYCPSGVCGAQNFISPADTAAPYSAVWVYENTCGSMPEDRYRIRARAEDNCGNVGEAVPKDVRLIGRPCIRGEARSGKAGTWVSELSVAGGRGQVVVDGTDAVFPAGGVERFTAAAGPGTHRFEATLVDATGRPGAWRFDLSALGAVPGSLRVVAGEAAVAGPSVVVFRLRGRPGERVVFSIDAGGGQ